MIFFELAELSFARVTSSSRYVVANEAAATPAFSERSSDFDKDMVLMKSASFEWARAFRPLLKLMSVQPSGYSHLVLLRAALWAYARASEHESSSSPRLLDASLLRVTFGFLWRAS